MVPALQEQAQPPTDLQIQEQQQQQQQQQQEEQSATDGANISNITNNNNLNITPTTADGVLDNLSPNDEQMLLQQINETL